MKYAIGLFLITGSLNCAAELVTITNTRDNTLFSNSVASTVTSGGADDHFFAGLTGAGQIVRGVIFFDLTNNIPFGSLITSAVLRLTMNKSHSAATIVGLQRLLTDWGEGSTTATGGSGGGGVGDAATAGSVTWLHTFFSNSFWNTEGGDFSSITSAVQTVNSVGFYTWSSTQMVADVQLWINSSTTNFGWIIRGNEAAAAKRYVSREGSTASQRPTLTIGYLAPPILTNTILALDSSGLSNEWSTVSGAVYQVQYSTNLLDDAAWQNFGDAITATAATASFVDTNLIEQFQTYRILRQ